MSRIRRIIEGAAKAQEQVSFGITVQRPVTALNYGFPLYSPYPVTGKARCSQPLSAKMLSRDVVSCGGCNNGKVPTRDKDGKRIGNPANWPMHEDCKGVGLRINKRYGRCG